MPDDAMTYLFTKSTNEEKERVLSHIMREVQDEQEKVVAIAKYIVEKQADTLRALSEYDKQVG